MSIFVGNQTSCWAGAPTEPFDFAVAQNFDAFEWFPDKKPGVGWEAGDLSAPVRQYIRQLAAARGIRLSVHARWQANPFLSEGYALLWEDLDFARDVGAALLNIHLFHEEGIAAFVEAIRPLVRRTAAAGLQLSIENTPHHSPAQFNELFARLRSFEDDEAAHVGMCLDVGHANLSSATRNDYLGFCYRLESLVPVIHLHLHENWGDTDSHLPIFTGPAARDDSGMRGLITWLQERSYSGSVILEQWPHPPVVLVQARQRLLQLWGVELVPPAPQSFHKAGPVAEPAKPVISLTGLAAELVAGNTRSRSWREKLELISGLLAREQSVLTLEDLVDIAIYLRFLAAGQIQCDEDGRHFRPAHHARIASQIQQRLTSLRNPANKFILRKIYPWLPSSALPFQRPEPLTRIRDIAHRNDISSELKRELKTTLQNKLHRCAGPEDLATASALLERFAAPGANYPGDFVEQFRIFHRELREFFNASSLEERLEALLPALPVNGRELARTFLRQKSGTVLEDQIAALRTLTDLRRALTDVEARGQGNAGQEFILADIALEEFAFVALSQVINGCDKAEAETALRGRLVALALVLENLRLSEIDPLESRAIHAELLGWGQVSPASGRTQLLRLRATVGRCRRLADDFGSRMVALFSARAERLGAALGVAEHAIRVFAESELRSHVVFQASKLADALLRWLRDRLNLAPWDVIVPGRASGLALVLESLDLWPGSSQETAVVVLTRASGDEEIPGKVAAIALGHELPHLAHLSVRARQAGVVVVACDEPAEFERLRGCQGKAICLEAFPDRVVVEIGADKDSRPQKERSRSNYNLQVRLSASPAWISLEEAVPETCGSKAAGARRLAQLTRQQGAGFHTPASLVVPFGIMEESLRANHGVCAEYRDLVQTLGPMEAGKFSETTRRLRELVRQLKVPDAIVSEVRRRFAPDSALIVRSSANGEDLEGFAGAGLYESFINVAPAEVALGIRRVWSSLWTLRAAESRRAVGIPHDQAHMAVLVQELVGSDFSFVLHTVNPITEAAGELYAEMVVGLGETLASAATAGTPYRLTVDKQSGVVTIHAFANFSQAARVRAGGGVREETLDYSQIEASRNAPALEEFGRRLAKVGVFVENALGSPQDIEGAIVGDRLYLVQARPQQGLAKP